MTLSKGKKAFLYIYPAFAMAAAWFGVPALISKAGKIHDPQEKIAASRTVYEQGITQHQEQNLGYQLYQKHCAYCHGVDGKGDGLAGVEPKARYFGWEQFKFVTTKNRIPCDSDLLNILNRGISGSAMPSFVELTDAEKSALIEHIRILTRAGYAARTTKKLAEDFDVAEMHQLVAKQVTPGETLPIPKEFAASTPESIENGKKLFAVRCAQCHGLEGKGDGKQEIRTEEDVLIRPRNLQEGIYRGGGSKEDLYARIMLGIGGKAMPTNADLPTKDIHDIINFVLSLNKAQSVEKEIKDKELLKDNAEKKEKAESAQK
jgi:mono/diheme cytochrome c family protein